VLDRVVIYLNRKECRVIRAWEVDPEEILRLDSYWLDPFVVLADVEDRARALVALRDWTLARGLYPQEQSVVLVCLAGLAAIVIRDEERLLKSFEGIDLGDKRLHQTLGQEWPAGALAEAAEFVLDTLLDRFSALPPGGATTPLFEVFHSCGPVICRAITTSISPLWSS